MAGYPVKKGVYINATEIVTESSPTYTGLTLSGLTASTVVYANATKAITSLANSAGYLYNDGAGALSWAAVDLSAYLKADRSVAMTGVTGPILVYLDADEKFASLANATGFLYNNGSGVLSYDSTVDADTVDGSHAAAFAAAFSGLAVGDLIYANAATTVTGLAAVATGQVLVSAGLTTAPAWSATPTVTSIVLAGTGTLTSTAGNATFTTSLTAATGNEAALSLNYTTNKATSGNDTGLLINQTDTSSPGASYLIDAQVGGGSKFSVRNDGALFLNSNAHYIFPVSAHQLTFQASVNYVFQTNADMASGNKFTFDAGNRALTASSGSQAYVAIGSKVNQSGTAAATDLLIDRTEVAIGSGTQRLLSARVETVEKVGIDNRGAIVVGMTADAVLQVGMVAMSDAGTAERFDVNGAGGTLPIGIVTGSGPTAQGTAYGLAVQGICYVAPAEDVVACTMGHVCFVDGSDAGYVDDNAALQAAGLNIGRYITSEAAIAFNGADDVDPTANTIVLDSTPDWVVGDPVVFWDSGDTAPTGMTTGAVYWIKTIATATVTLSETRGGATLDITGDGSGTTMYLMRLPKVILHWQ